MCHTGFHGNIGCSYTKRRSAVNLEPSLCVQFAMILPNIHNTFQNGKKILMRADNFFPGVQGGAGCLRGTGEILLYRGVENLGGWRLRPR